MENFTEYFRNMRFGSTDHIEAAPGDYIGPEGRLCCGKCGTPKEYRWPLNGHWVPCVCQCQKDALEAQARRRAEAEEEARVRELARYSIIDARTKAARFENAVIRPDSAEAFQMAKRYVERWDEVFALDSGFNGLMFYGPPGSGKSYLAACVANALMARRVPVLMTSIVKLTNAPQEQVNEVLRQSCSARLLVLDDLGAERDTSFKLEQVFNVVDSRYATKRPLIVTTNLSMEDLRSGPDVRYNRIFERIKSMCLPVRMDGESWRKRQAAAAYRDMKRMLGRM